MNNRQFSILSSGMVTCVGYSAPASCAAMRGGLYSIKETNFMFDGEFLMGCKVAYEEGWVGREKMILMVVSAIEECLSDLESWSVSRPIPLLLCLAEASRPGRLFGLDDSFLQEVKRRLSHPNIISEDSRVFLRGRLGGVHALEYASQLIDKGVAYCVLAGVDSFLVASTLESLYSRRRLHSEKNSDGLYPGEAAGAVLIGMRQGPKEELQCLGIGRGNEPAPLESEKPCRADGLVEAIRNMLTNSKRGYEDIDYRITDIGGEQYGFKEASIALTRTMRTLKDSFDLWHPSEYTGEIGAAIVPIILGIALAAAQKGYAPGPGVMCHFSSDEGERAALLLRYER